MDLGLGYKRVLVVGASRGIGRAIAEAFLSEGARVALMARSPEPLQATMRELGEAHGAARVMALPGDAADAGDWQQVTAGLQSAWGGLDIVVANAGDGRSSADALPDAERFTATWRENFGVAECTARAVVPLLQVRGGCLLFIGSIAGREAIGAPTDYSVAKAAVQALAKQLARKLAPAVRVNCLAPGNVLFPGGAWADKQAREPERIARLIEAAVPMRRFATPREVADAALFLCSERARFVTGATLVVDGGQTVGLG